MLTLWDPATGQQIESFWGHSYGVVSIAMIPGSNHCVTAGNDGALRVWELEGDSTARVRSEKHDEAVTAVAVLDKGEHVVSTSTLKQARLWCSRTGAKLADLNGESSYDDYAAITPNGRWTAYTDPEGSATIELWDGENRNVSRSFKNPISDDAAPATPDYRHMESWDEQPLQIAEFHFKDEDLAPENRLAFLNAVPFTSRTRREIEEAPVYDGCVESRDLQLKGHVGARSSLNGNCIAITPNAERVAFFWRGDLKIWDLKMAMEICCLPYGGPEGPLAISPDGTTVVSAAPRGSGWDGAFLIVNASARTRIIPARRSRNRIVTRAGIFFDNVFEPTH